MKAARVSLPGCILAGAAILFHAACSLPSISRQVEAISHLGHISGQVSAAAGIDADIKVALFVQEQFNFHLRSAVTAGERGEFVIRALPGTYYLGAFSDANHDGIYQRTEPATVYGDPTPFTVSQGQDLRLAPLFIEAPIPESGDGNHASVDIRQSLVGTGEVKTLDDPVFAEEAESLGQWQPVRYIEEGRAGLFMLQAYDSARTPVLFVHGMNGGGNDWTDVIAALDPDRFQAWIFQYPSGLPLDLLSDILARSVFLMSQTYDFDRLPVIAHSMGGLVARSFVLKLARDYPEAACKLSLLMTLNSPLGGMDSAQYGVDSSPIVVPSWRDVATDSTFIRQLLGAELPATVPHFLIFSFLAGQGDDGVVSTVSQLPLGIQMRAHRIYGFNTSHAGILHDPDFIGLLRDVLSQQVVGPGEGAP